MLEAHNDGRSLEKAITISPGWSELEKLVATAAQLTDTMAADPLSHVAQGYNRFRRYAPRMLRCLDIQATPVAEPLMAAAAVIRNGLDCPSLLFGQLPKGAAISIRRARTADYGK